MLHHKPRPDVVELRPPSAADRLERLARQPRQPHREILLMLAARVRALEALVHAQEVSDDAQLQLSEVA